MERSFFLNYYYLSVFENVHIVTPVCTVCAVPELALLLVSGVLECWKHLTGRFNIQLTGSQTSYITAEPPPPQKKPSSLYPGFLPIRCPSHWRDLSIPLHSPLLSCSAPSLFEQGGGVLTALQFCLPISPPADYI